MHKRQPPARLPFATKMVLTMRFELMTSPLPMECSTTELREPNYLSMTEVITIGAGSGNRTRIISLEG